MGQSDADPGWMPEPCHLRHLPDCRKVSRNDNCALPDIQRQTIVACKLDEKASRP
jgi:hypothetical protein